MDFAQEGIPDDVFEKLTWLGEFEESSTGNYPVVDIALLSYNTRETQPVLVLGLGRLRRELYFADMANYPKGGSSLVAQPITPFYEIVHTKAIPIDSITSYESLIENYIRQFRIQLPSDMPVHLL